jgi:hypothetical protein
MKRKVKDDGELLSLLDLAVKFDPDGLAYKCALRLKSAINIQNVFEIYKKGVLHGVADLSKAALEFILA